MDPHAYPFSLLIIVKSTSEIQLIDTALFIFPGLINLNPQTTIIDSLCLLRATVFFSRFGTINFFVLFGNTGAVSGIYSVPF